MDTKKMKDLLSQVQAIKAFATSVEAELQAFLGGVGTARRSQKEIDREAIRLKARKQFSK